MNKVVLAENAGFCFGVTRAVEEALKSQKKYNKKIYTLGPLIHNNDVVNMLETNNIFSIKIEDLNELIKGDVVIIRSHGVSKDIIDLLKEREITIIDATCPYVSKIQNIAKKYNEEGFQIIILGDKNHPEVIGINGWCDDSALITKDGDFKDTIPSKVCALSQTTEKYENWQKLLSSLSIKTKEILAFNTICSATKVRQESASKLSKEVDIMFVIGGKNSSNTTKLYEICKNNCKQTYHIENINELNEICTKASLENKKIGVTAGASTPKWIIEDVVEFLKI